MAIRLHDSILGGAIYNASRNSVHGHLFIRGIQESLTLELTGAPCADLAGRSFEFTMPEDERDVPEAEMESIRAMQPRQIGPTGDITAARKVKTFACSPEEYYRLSKAGNPPEVTWQYCLYIEWFGQNGRVVVELPGARIRLIDLEAESPADAIDDPDEPSDGEIVLSQDVDELEEEAASEDPFNLFDADLEYDLELSAEELDAAVSESKGRGSDVLRELELMDTQIEYGDTLSLRELLEGTLPLPDPANLDETQGAEVLKTILARIAPFGIAYHVCEHCTLLDAYAIFMHHLIDDECILPGMFGSSWVQHFATSDFCETCVQELETEMGDEDLFDEDGLPDPEDDKPF